MYFNLDEMSDCIWNANCGRNMCRRKINMLSSAIESFRGGVIILERTDHYQYDICYISNGMYRILKYPDKNELIHSHQGNVFAGVHPADVEYVKQLLENSAYSGADFEAEYRVVNSFGKYIWVKIRGIVKYENNGLFYYISYEDTSEKYNYIELLKNEQNKCNIAIENSDVEFMTYDIAGKKLMISRGNKIKSHLNNSVIENVPESLYQSEYILPESMEEITKLNEKIIAGEISASAIIWRKSEDGKSKWCERINCVTVADDKASPAYVYIIGKDITELKKAQKRYSAILESRAKLPVNSIGCYILNISKNWCGDSLGVCERKDELLETETVDGFFDSIYKYIYDDEMKKQYMDTFNRRSLLNSFYEGKRIISLKHLYKSTGGRTLWVRSKINLLKNPNTGDIEVILNATDITKERQHEKLMGALVSGSYVFVICLEAETGIYTFYKNGESKESHWENGYDYDCRKYCENNVISHNKEEIINDVTAENILLHLENENSVYQKIVNVINEDNKECIYQFVFRYLDFKNKQVMITCSDVTRVIEKSYEKTKKLQSILSDLKKANKAKSDFLSRMSHDMRTPMNAIIGLAQITLQSDELSLQTRQNMQDIYDSGKLLLSLINDTLDMNKIESNKLKLRNEPASFEMILRRIISCVKPMADEKNISIRVRYINAYSDKLIMDKLRVEQILLNLISNSIKFTDDGGRIEVIIEQTFTEKDVCDIKICIRDNGIGISPEFMSRLFEPFEQENDSMTHTYCGTGLGMAIVKGLVEMMNGKIDVESQKGKGTSVKVQLKFNRSHDEIVKKEIPQAKESNLEGKRVLLCEDHELNAKVALYMLRDKKMEADHAVNGQMAVEMFKEKPEGYYDLILMDIRMPVLDGIEATQQIRSMDRCDAKTIPIIAMTANAYVQDIEKCLEAGMNAHIAKPIDMNNMYMTVEKYIK